MLDMTAPAPVPFARTDPAPVTFARTETAPVISARRDELLERAYDHVLAHGLAGMSLRVPLDWRPVFGIPGNAYTFENAHWGWEVIAPLMERSSPLRTRPVSQSAGVAMPIDASLSMALRMPPV